MNIKKISGWILKLPLILLNLATLGVGIYAAMGNVPGFLISWAAPAIIGGFQIAYLIGALLISKSKANEVISTDADEDSEEVSAEEYDPEQQ
jgi:hypothetical protein